MNCATIDYREIQERGHLLKVNRFDTKKGKYRLEYYRYFNMIWIIKYKDDTVVEVNNLSEMDEVDHESMRL